MTVNGGRSMEIGMLVNGGKDVGFSVIKKLVKSISVRGGSTRLAMVERRRAVRDTVKYPCEVSGLLFEDESVLSECDMVISIGGDGTLIRTVSKIFEKRIPIFGINMGNLGYLSEVEVAEIDNMVERVFCGDYNIEERLMLTARLSDIQDSETDVNYTVLNDVSITRGDLSHSIRLKVFINDTLLESFPGDGLIIATPTGSTAYSLSAGGPVIDPETHAISIVPVCPHIVFSRPIILSPNRIIKILIERKMDAASISFDGIECCELRKGKILEISRSNYNTRMVRFNSNNFYGMLKNKLFCQT